MAEDDNKPNESEEDLGWDEAMQEQANDDAVQNESATSSEDEGTDLDWGAAMAEQQGETPQETSGDPDWGDAMEEQTGEDDAEVGDDPKVAVHGGVGGRMDQSEIDNLMGYEGGQDEQIDENASPFERLAKVRSAQRDHLPMLNIIFEQLTRYMSTSLRGMVSEVADVSMTDSKTLRFGDYLRNMGLPALIGIVRIPKWKEQALVTVDTTLVYALVDMLLGGREAPPAKAEGRPYTLIEMNLVNEFLQTILQDLSHAFSAVIPVDFELDRLETTPAFAGITRENNAAIRYTIRVQMGGRDGALEFVIPYGTLEPARESLGHVTMIGNGGSDEIWHGHFRKEVPKSNSEVTAVLAEADMTMSELSQLKVGSILELDITPQDAVRILCNGRDLGTGYMTTVGDTYAIEVSEIGQGTGTDG